MMTMAIIIVVLLLVVAVSVTDDTNVRYRFVDSLSYYK